MNEYDTDHDILEIIDDTDRVIGTATRRDAHARGLMHRAVHVFLFDAEGRVYVQRRSQFKDRHADKLDSSAAGHLEPGESYAAAAGRELSEELGISAQVSEVFRVPASAVTDNELVVLFTARSSAIPAPDAREVSDLLCPFPDELTKWMSSDPDDFVPAFIYLWNRYWNENRNPKSP
jgi:isopentenyldiphosphate isomerase